MDNITDQLIIDKMNELIKRFNKFEKLVGKSFIAILDELKMITEELKEDK